MAKRKAAKTTESSAKASGGTAEFVVTLDPQQKKIAKVESIDASGRRHILSASDFARLIGGDEAGDFAAALEEIFEAGIAEGMEDALSVMSGEPSETGARRSGRESDADRIIEAEVQRLLLRRAVRRSAVRKRASAGGNGLHGTH